MNNDPLINSITGAGINSPKNIKVLEEDIKKLGLELGDYPVATYEDGKKTLNVKTEHRVSNAFEVLSVAGHIVAATGTVPVITKTKNGEVVFQFKSLDEARKSMDDALAQEYFEQIMPTRVPEEIRDETFEGELRKDIKDRIEVVMHEYGEIGREIKNSKRKTLAKSAMEATSRYSEFTGYSKLTGYPELTKAMESDPAYSKAAGKKSQKRSTLIR